MLCWNCSDVLPEGAIFCGSCGVKMSQAPVAKRAALGPFELGAERHRGKLTLVLRGRDLRLGRDVALKLPREDAPVTLGLSLRRQAYLAASLSHPNAQAIYSVEEHDEKLF